jgi:hypothetical protein
MKLLKTRKTVAPTPEAQKDADLLAKLRQEIVTQEALKEHAYATRGESIAAGIPDDKAAADYEAAVKRIADLHAAIAAIERRMGAALERMKADEKKEKLKALTAALTDHHAKARMIEADFDTFRRNTKALETSFSAARSAAAALGDDALVRLLNDGLLKFKFYALHACQTMPGCAVPHVEKLKPYAENFPDAPTKGKGV